MPRQPIDFHYRGLAPSRAVEAAARRRMRSLEAAYPAVLGWTVDLEGPQLRGAQALPHAAQVQAQLAGGARLQGRGEAMDALGALRLAFNALEPELDADSEGARHRAAQWLTAVRNRIAQRASGA